MIWVYLITDFMLHRKKTPVPKTAVGPKNHTLGTKTLPSVAKGSGLNEKQLKPPPLFPTSQIKAETAPKVIKQEKVVKKTW